jgi:zinc transporter ZupT
MRRISPTVLPLVLFGVVLLLSLFGGLAGVVSFLLLRAGYGFVVWGVLPFLALLLVALVLGALVWRAASGALPGIGRRDGSTEEKPREDSLGRPPDRGDDV